MKQPHAFFEYTTRYICSVSNIIDLYYDTHLLYDDYTLVESLCGYSNILPNSVEVYIVYTDKSYLRLI